MISICLTGGPGAGKSSALSVLTQVLSERGYKTLIANEAATSLILSGIVPGDTISMEDFQEFVLDYQLSTESLCRKAVKFYDEDKVVIIHDRGLCDQMAYVDRSVFEKMLNSRGITLSEAYGRYDCVLHLVTAAKGAADHYVWNDPTKEDCGNNAARSESPEEAIIKDEKTLNAWIGHSHLRVIDNSTDFNDKIARVVEEVCNVLGEPIPKEIERKFLITRPTEDEINALGCISKSNIIQTYLVRKKANVERRIRQRGTKAEGFNFYYTEKRELGNGERHEVEDKITPTEYISYLSEADTNLHQISKKRYCFIHKNKYYEMDIYPFSDKYAILEIELNDINEEIELPPLNIIKEVTDDEAYRNASLAKTLTLDLSDEDKVKEAEKEVNSDWIYETGREEPEILGSGSHYYNVFKTASEKKAFEASKEAGRTYLIRYKKIDGRTNSEMYDGYSKSWI